MRKLQADLDFVPDIPLTSQISSVIKIIISCILLIAQYDVFTAVCPEAIPAIEYKTHKIKSAQQ